MMHRTRPILKKLDINVKIVEAGQPRKIPNIPASARICLHHHNDPRLLEYRAPGSFAYLMHHFSSSFNAISSLIGSQESRDKFMSYTRENDDDFDGPVISKLCVCNIMFIFFFGYTIEYLTNINLYCFKDTSVLGQSDMPLLKPLTLFDELNNPILDQYQFDIGEFLSGCTFALDKFHKAKDVFLPGLAQAFDDEDEQAAKKWTNKNILSDDEIANFNKMITPECCEICMHESMQRAINERVYEHMKKEEPGSFTDIMNPDVGDKEVGNIALVSVRVEEIYPSVFQDDKKKDNDPNAPLEDESLSPPVDDSAQVVLQVEVLYELKQSSVSEKGERVERTYVMVGKFEGCLAGYPSDDDDLKWRIASYRPAVEWV